MLLGGLAMAFEMAGDAHCSTLIGERAHLVADGWTKLAERNPAVRLVLVRATTGGAWGEALFASAGLAIPIMAHHGLYPDYLPNPWAMVLASPEVAAEDARRMADSIANAFGPDGPQNGTPTATPEGESTVEDIAERQRREAEARRADHHRGAVDL
jgi:hypothetical protein